VIRDTESSALHVLRMIQEEAMKENSAAIWAQVPVEVATYLLNEKRSEIAKLEARHKVEIVLVPNRHLETPHYRLERIRHDDDRLGSYRASYSIAEAPAEDTSYFDSKFDQGKARPEAAVRSVTPDHPPPPASEPVVRKEALSQTAQTAAPQTPAAPEATPAPHGLFGKILGFFRRKPANEASATAPAAGAVQPEVATPKDRREGGERGESGRGGRGSRGPRGDRSERGDRGERSADRGERSGDRAERPDRNADRADRGERSDRPDRAERSDRGDRGGQREGRPAREPRDSQNREARTPREGEEAARDARPPRRERAERGAAGASMAAPEATAGAIASATVTDVAVAAAQILPAAGSGPVADTAPSEGARTEVGRAVPATVADASGSDLAAGPAGSPEGSEGEGRRRSRRRRSGRRDRPEGDQLVSDTTADSVRSTVASDADPAAQASPVTTRELASTESPSGELRTEDLLSRKVFETHTPVPQQATEHPAAQPTEPTKGEVATSPMEIAPPVQAIIATEPAAAQIAASEPIATSPIVVPEPVVAAAPIVETEPVAAAAPIVEPERITPRQPEAEAVIVPATEPAPPQRPATTPAVANRDSLESLVADAGLQWVETRADRPAEQVASAQVPPPRPSRRRKARTETVEEPLVQIETRS
jgi:ribonuclease E